MNLLGGTGYWHFIEALAARSAKCCMRLFYFLGGMSAGAFTLFRIPHLAEAINDLVGGGDYKRFMATAFICLTILTGIVTVVCVKKTFPPPRSK